jgi:ethanolamine utilization microcompartment shell protein EutL
MHLVVSQRPIRYNCVTRAEETHTTETVHTGRRALGQSGLGKYSMLGKTLLLIGEPAPARITTAVDRVLVEVEHDRRDRGGAQADLTTTKRNHHLSLGYR